MTSRKLAYFSQIFPFFNPWKPVVFDVSISHEKIRRKRCSYFSYSEKIIYKRFRFYWEKSTRNPIFNLFEKESMHNFQNKIQEKNYLQHLFWLKTYNSYSNLYLPPDSHNNFYFWNLQQLPGSHISKHLLPSLSNFLQVRKLLVMKSRYFQDLKLLITLFVFIYKITVQ